MQIKYDKWKIMADNYINPIKQYVEKNNVYALIISNITPHWGVSHFLILKY